MNVYQELIFSYLEEDNTQRAYFRVKPLLATSGDIRQEAQAAWADEGALRIVPDRAEQYHFKDRMRTLGSYCVMDLTHTTEEANKIRTNKNYRAKGTSTFSSPTLSSHCPTTAFFTCWTVPRSRPANWPSKR